MKRRFILILSVILIIGVIGSAQAQPGKNLQEPFVTVTAEGCLIPNSDPLYAMWSFVAEIEPKFGGDVFFAVDITLGEEIISEMIKFEITRFQEGSTEDYTGQMYYSCEGFTCTGTLDNLVAILDDAVLALYPDYSTYTAQLYKVFVKPLNPGKSNGSKRQNYQLTPIDVCEVLP